MLQPLVYQHNVTVLERTLTVRHGSFSPARMMWTDLPSTLSILGSMVATMSLLLVDSPRNTCHDLCCTQQTQTVTDRSRRGLYADHRHHVRQRHCRLGEPEKQKPTTGYKCSALT